MLLIDGRLNGLQQLAQQSALTRFTDAVRSKCVCVDGTLATRFPLEVILALFVTKIAICASWMLSMAAAHTHTHKVVVSVHA